MDKALEIEPDDPKLIDAYGRTLLAAADLDHAENWARKHISDAAVKSPSVLATALATALVASTRRKMIDLYGDDWATTVRPANADTDKAAFLIDQETERRLARFVNESAFAARKNSPGPGRCPVCGEEHRIIQRNSLALTNAFHLYFDMENLATRVLSESPDDAGALTRAERVIKAMARGNPEYFSVDLCECGVCGICYVDHPFNADQVERYYATQARAYEIGGQPFFSRAHAFNWVRSKAAPIAYLRARLGKPFTGLSFLDVGCAEGIMCALARLLGAEVFGIEPNTRACRYAREVLGLDGVVDGQYDDDSFPDRAFDIVMSHHTMEHALNPPQFAGHLSRHTAPGGHLLLQVPCADAASVDHLAGMGNFHLFGFRRTYLEKQLTGLGFDLMESNHLPGPTTPREDQIDPATGVAIWGEHESQISILCVNKEF